VIVVNNRCTDGSMAVIQHYRRRMSHLRVIDAPEKQGAAYAMNTGVRAARGELLAFCDADDVVGEGWISAMGAALATQDFVSGPHEIQRLNQSAPMKNRNNPQRTGVQQYTDPPYLPHAGAGNLGVRRTVFEAIGGFDESMRDLFDTDFCWRMQLSGIAINPAPGAVLHVRYRESASGVIHQAMRYGEKNVFIYKRYRPYGMPKYPWTRSVRASIGLIRGVTALFNPERRAFWLWDFGWYLGRLMGCFKYRVLAL
jgi:GT2 family glycosyltransferase